MFQGCVLCLGVKPAGQRLHGEVRLQTTLTRTLGPPPLCNCVPPGAWMPSLPCSPRLWQSWHCVLPRLYWASRWLCTLRLLRESRQLSASCVWNLCKPEWVLAADIVRASRKTNDSCCPSMKIVFNWCIKIRASILKTDLNFHTLSKLRFMRCIFFSKYPSDMLKNIRCNNILIIINS